MPWGAVAGAAVNVIGSAMTADSGGGAGSSSTSKEPWSEAAPWLKEQIKTGQDMQAQYTATPFNAQQLNAYANMGRQTGYMNNLVPDLLGQISNQGVGFDRSNTNSRVTPYTFNGSGSGMSGGKTNLLDQLSNPSTLNQYTSAANPPAAAPAPAPAASPFQAFDPGQVPLSDYGRMTLGVGGSGGQPLAYNGGLGAFKYGDAAPTKGTQAYLDYQQYLMGAGDPLGMYTGGNSGNGGA